MASAAAGVLGAPAAAAPVDCIRAISNYIKLMLNNALCKGMKTLLLDKETVREARPICTAVAFTCSSESCVCCCCTDTCSGSSFSRVCRRACARTPFIAIALLFAFNFFVLQKTMVSMVMSMNDILSRQVFLIESLESMHTAKTHMKVRFIVDSLPNSANKNLVPS